VTVGNWVSSGTSSGATLLNTIVSQDPIQIYFDVSEANALKYKRQAAVQAKLGNEALKGLPVGIALPDETGFPHAGRLDFVDNRLDAGTATLRARAVVENKAGLFAPGMFGRVRVSGEGQRRALLIPDEAIGTDQASRFVYVVAENGQAQRRAIKLGPLTDGLRIVREGIAAEDWIVVRGTQKVRPGQTLAVKREPIKVSDAISGAPTPHSAR
jgi:RND family efflux transporter MFP subunit